MTRGGAAAPDVDLIEGVEDVDVIRFEAFFWAGDLDEEVDAADDVKPEEFEFIVRWSPYQNVRQGVAYPAIYVITGDMDSRVDPVHARKTVAKLQWATSSGRPIVLNYQRRMGHAGAIISGGSGTAQAKIKAMKTHGVHVCENLGTLGEMCAQVFK